MKSNDVKKHQRDDLVDRYYTIVHKPKSKAELSQFQVYIFVIFALAYAGWLFVDLGMSFYLLEPEYLCKKHHSYVACEMEEICESELRRHFVLDLDSSRTLLNWYS